MIKTGLIALAAVTTLGASQADAGRFYVETHAPIWVDVHTYDEEGKPIAMPNMRDGINFITLSQTTFLGGYTKYEILDSYLGIDGKKFQVTLTPNLAGYGPTTFWVNPTTNTTVHIHGDITGVNYQTWTSETWQ